MSADAASPGPQAELTDDCDPQERFELVRKLGQGAYGTVHLAQERAEWVAQHAAAASGNDGNGADGRHSPGNSSSLPPEAIREGRGVVAVKMIPLVTDDDELAQVHSEIATLRRLRHPNVVRHFATYQSLDSLWLAMEFCEGGSVDNVAQQLAAPLPERVIAYVCREVLQGLVYLHKQHIIHRDVKCGNLLLTQDGHVKLSDFGTSVQLLNTISKRNSFVGTLYWMAPETIMERDYDARADVWALGVTLIEMAEGRPPHFDLHYTRALFAIPRQDPPKLKEQAQWSEKMHTFLARCVVKEPKERPTAEELLDDPFVRDVVGTPADVVALVAKARSNAAADAAEVDSGRSASTDSDMAARYAGGGAPLVDDGDDDRTAIDRGPVLEPTATGGSATGSIRNQFDEDGGGTLVRRAGASATAPMGTGAGAAHADRSPGATAGGPRQAGGGLGPSSVAYGSVPQLPYVSLDTMSVDELALGADEPVTKDAVMATLLGREQARFVGDDRSEGDGALPSHTTQALLRCLRHNRERIFKRHVVSLPTAERAEEAAATYATILKALYKV